MGLLTTATSPGQNKIKIFIAKHHTLLCVSFYVLAIVWFCLLANENVFSNTYVSENALLPGLVAGEYSAENEIQLLYADLEREIRSLPPLQIPSHWIYSKFKELQLEPYLHNFTFVAPIKHNITYKGINVYGILRAPRSAGLESLVLSVPYQTEFTSSIPSIALIMSFAKYCRRQKYWAKDIIFLVTEHQDFGLQAWLEAYHGVSFGSIISGELKGRSGAIQAAINLELSSLDVNAIDVKLSGLNGQYPNLDLVNLAYRIAGRLSPTGTVSRTSFADNYSWVRKMYNLLSMVALQSSGMPDGNHGLFYQFGIEAITLSLYSDGSKRRKIDLRSVGRILEGIFRSLNNLLERFHQSFFFYFLPSYEHYVSIGIYMPCIGLLVLPLFLTANIKWTKSGATLEENVNDPTSPQPCKTRKNNIFGQAIFVLPVASHSLGYLAMKLPPIIVAKYPFLSYVSVYFAMACLSTILIIILTTWISTNKLMSDEAWNFTNFCCLMELGVSIVGMSLYNFSLAFIAAVIYVLPVVWIDHISGKWYQKLLWILINPLIALYWIVLLITVTNYYEDSAGRTLKFTYSAIEKYFVYSIIQGAVYGYATLNYIIISLLPNWLMFWSILLANNFRNLKLHFFPWS